MAVFPAPNLEDFPARRKLSDRLTFRGMRAITPYTIRATPPLETNTTMVWRRHCCQSENIALWVWNPSSVRRRIGVDWKATLPADWSTAESWAHSLCCCCCCCWSCVGVDCSTSCHSLKNISPSLSLSLLPSVRPRIALLIYCRSERRVSMATLPLNLA